MGTAQRYDAAADGGPSRRTVFIGVFAPNEEIIREKTIRTQKIAELLIDNVDLGGLALSNGQILFSTLKSIEWEPPPLWAKT